jgi:4-hydroxybenzoate polyprenyltransferase
LIEIFTFNYVGSDVEGSPFIFSIIFTLLIATYEVIHQISHRKEDKKANVKSLPVVFGVENSLKTIFCIQFSIVFIASFALSLNFQNNLIFVGTVIFAFLRIFQIFLWKKDFSKLRNKIFGLEEGFYYLIFLMVVHI